MALVIATGNTKGGVGKSMLASNTAIELLDRGYRVSFMDGEEGWPTGTALKSIEPELDVWCANKLEEIDDLIDQRQADYDVIVVDTPGKTGDAVNTLCLLADLIIVPLQTSMRDLRQAKPIIRRILRVREATGKPDARLVLNCTRKRDISASIYRKKLEPLGIPVATTQIRRLDVYKDYEVVMRDVSLNTDGAADDIRSLVDEMILPRLFGRRTANA